MSDTERVIIFVDDEANILSALKRELRAWASKEGYSIAAFESAAKALEFLGTSADSVALIVSDLRMPEMKGSDFLLAAKDRWPEIPTILLSGYSEAEELMKAVKAGIFSYILKPWDPDYLRAELEKALELRRAREENAAYSRLIQEELRWAGTFQRTFMSLPPAQAGGPEAEVTWKPVEGLYCGGDYFDLIGLGGRRWLALAGDVSGHGIKAAFVTGFLKTMIYAEYVRAVESKPFSPGAFLGWLNDRVIFELRRNESVIVTFAAAVIDLDKGAMRYANAGHCKPWIIRGGGPTALPISDLALGVAPGVAYREGEESLGPGDVVFLHSDGLVEAGERSSSGGVDLAAALAAVPWGEGFHGRLMERCLAETKAPAFEDDVMILTLRVP